MLDRNSCNTDQYLPLSHRHQVSDCVIALTRSEVVEERAIADPTEQEVLEITISAPARLTLS
jgi:hypothetical protein